MAWWLNIIGLVLSTIAAGLMYYYPPRGIVQYTEAGAPQVNFIGNPVPGGKRASSQQRALSRLAPCLLAFGFLLQLISAYMQRP